MKKKTVYFFLISLFLTLITGKASTENLNIKFVDVDLIISQSTAGKKVQKSFDKKIEKENAKFKKVEDELKKEQEEILKQKNIISKDELENKIKEFQSNLNELRANRAKFNREMNKKNLESTNKMVNEINKILVKYASDNSISFVIQKKNIIIGKSELDITNEILEEFNSKIKSIE